MITIQIVEKRGADGERQAILAHCPAVGHCKNILSTKDGDAYFTNTDLVANTIDSDKKRKSKIMKILAGSALLTSVAVTIFTFTKSKAILRKTEKLKEHLLAYNKLPQPKNEKLLEENLRSRIDEIMVELNKHRVNTHSLGELKEALQQDDLNKAIAAATEVVNVGRDRVTNLDDAGWNFMLGAIVAAPLLIYDLYNTVVWKNNRKNFFYLFVDGKPITVTKSELRGLIRVLSKHLKVKAAPGTYSYFRS